MSAAIVAQAKAELEAAGVELDGPCGAFAITNRAAQKLGLGILSKPSGNNCQGFATDIVMARDGRIWDVLVDGGGENRPAWNAGDPVEASRYRDPVGAAPPVTPPTQPGTPLSGDAFHSFDLDVRASAGRIEASLKRIEQRLNEPPAQAPLPTVTFPSYSGKVGTQTVTLKPVKAAVKK